MRVRISLVVNLSNIEKKPPMLKLKVEVGTML